VVAEQISSTLKHLPKQELSDDFNMKLFERIHNAPRAEQVREARLPKAAPSAFFYRLRLLAPALSLAGVLVIALTLFPGTAEIDTQSQPGIASVTDNIDTRPVSQGYRPTGMRGIRLEDARLESLAVAIAARNGSIFERLGRQQKRDFGTFSSGSLMQNVNQQPAGRRYILPNATSKQQRPPGDAAF
jgi:hypothetical protein